MPTINSLRAVATSPFHMAMRRWFGNTVHYKKNVSGMLNWARARRAFRGEINPRIEEFFGENYYCRLPPGTVNIETMARIRQKYEAMILDDRYSENPFRTNKALFAKYNHGGVGEIPDVRRDIVNPGETLPELFQIFDEKLVRALVSCLGSNFQVDQCDAWRNYHCPPEIRDKFEPGNDRWHFDHHVCDRLRLFVNLSDVTSDDGPTSFFDRRYSKFLMFKGYENAKRRESETGGIPPHFFHDNPRMLEVTGPMGSATALFTSYCLHRGGVRKPGHHRDLIAFTMSPSAHLRIPFVTHADGMTSNGQYK